MKIKKIRLEYLRNEAHYQFMLLLQKLFAAYPVTSNIVADLIPALDDLIRTEGQLVDALKASQYTEQIAEADRRVDRNIAGINAAIASALRHYDPAVAKAAREVEVRMKSFRGEIARKAYGEESAAVKILVADLRNTYPSQVAVLPGLNGWITELNEAQAAFEQLFILRNSELATRPQEKLQAVRKAINRVYRNIVERIDAYGILHGIDITQKFVSELNREIEYFNEHSRHQAKKNIDKAAVASIPDQLWEGKPVTVLPVVTYEGSELVFAKDYELSYRDNVRPGTAAVLIHGKGTFQGMKTVSFNISEPKKVTE